MDQSYNCSRGEDPVITGYITDENVQFETVTVYYEFKCPGCDFVNQTHHFKQEPSTEVKTFLCQKCHGYFLLTEEKTFDYLSVQARYTRTSGPEPEEQKINIPLSFIVDWKLSNEEEIIRFLLPKTLTIYFGKEDGAEILEDIRIKN